MPSKQQRLGILFKLLLEQWDFFLILDNKCINFGLWTCNCFWTKHQRIFCVFVSVCFPPFVSSALLFFLFYFFNLSTIFACQAFDHMYKPNVTKQHNPLLKNYLFFLSLFQWESFKKKKKKFQVNSCKLNIQFGAAWIKDSRLETTKFQAAKEIENYWLSNMWVNCHHSIFGLQAKTTPLYICILIKIIP